MSLVRIINHPLNQGKRIKSIQHFLKWQMNPYPIIYPNSSFKFVDKKGLTGATGNLYCGLHEFSERSRIKTSNEIVKLVDISKN